MRIFKINRLRASRRALDEALAVLRRGGIVVCPTETAYGLAADSTRPDAVRRIFLVKGRGKEKSLPLAAASINQVRKFARLTEKILTLAKRHWPGPLTVVASARGSLARGARGPGGTVAVRVPGLAWPRRLAEALGRPVTSTSANLSGRPAIYRSSEIRRAFRGRVHQPDLFLDAGDLPPRPASTIVRFRRGRPEVLRQGAVKVD